MNGALTNGDIATENHAADEEETEPKSTTVASKAKLKMKANTSSGNDVNGEKSAKDRGGGAVKMNGGHHLGDDDEDADADADADADGDMDYDESRESLICLFAHA